VAVTRQHSDFDDLRQTVRALTADWRSSGRYTPRCDSWLRSADPEFSKELAIRGLIGLTWPRQFGGGELDAKARLVVTEELLRAGAPVAAHWIADRQIGPAILRHGNADLQREILPGITAADYFFCLGMSEPEAGSDLAAVRTSAKRVIGGWRISGRKTWTSNAHLATHAYVLARTDNRGRKYDGLTEFVVDIDGDGVEVSPIVDMSGEHHFNELTLTEVFVPEHRVIGTVGNGWRQVIEQLSFERGGPERVLSTYPLLVACIQLARQAGSEELVRQVGHLVARLATLRQMCWDLAEAVDRGEAPVTQAAELKWLGTRFETDVIECARHAQAAQSAFRGLYDQALLASPGFSIRGGASDVLLSIVAKAEVRR
jgi:alkylation response protein AidB-like acyl-CoA dehydrogenase